MRKFLGLILILSLIFCGLPFSSNAAVEETFEINSKTIEIMDEEDVLSSEKLQLLAAFLADDSIETSSTYSILCIFGHKIEYSSALVIDHNYYSSSPRCLETIYEVEVCTRESCSYMNKTIVSQTRIAACHG